MEKRYRLRNGIIVRNLHSVTIEVMTIPEGMEIPYGWDIGAERTMVIGSNNDFLEGSAYGTAFDEGEIIDKEKELQDEIAVIRPYRPQHFERGINLRWDNCQKD